MTEADVERIVRRDFSPEQFAEVMAMLNEYGVESWQLERPRVKLAALKLADGDLHKLRNAVNDAKCDYRDVLSGAEYPGYSIKCTGLRKPPVEEQQRIIASDRKQYEAWLKGES